MQNEGQAIFQLAHECIHLLAPTGGGGVTCLEEGLAAVFARLYTKQAAFGDWYDTVEKYIEAAKLVDELLRIEPELVKRIRVSKPTISRLTSEDLIAASPKVERPLAEALTLPF
jgi:hypothetical protein